MIRYLKKFRWQWLVSILLTILVDVALSMAAIFEQDLVDTLLDGTIQAIQRSAVVFVVYSGFSAGMYIVSSLLQSRLMVKVTNAMRTDMMRGILRKKINEFQERDSSDYSSAIVNDIAVIRMRFFNMFFMTLFSVFGILASVAIIIYYKPILALLALFGGIVITILPVLLGNCMGKVEKIRSEKIAGMMQVMTNIFEGFSVIASFGVRRIFQKQYEENIKELQNVEYKSEGWSSFTNGLSQFLSSIIQALLLVYAGFLVYNNKLSMGAFFVFSTINSSMCSCMTMLLQSIPLMLSAKPVIDRMNELIDVEEAKCDGKKISFDRELLVDNVSFGYKGRDNVLNNICVCIGKSQKCAVIGESGSGKTTLIRLLHGDYPDYTGKICYDGTELKDADLSSLYEIMTIVQQEVYLFEDTIKNNVSLYEDYSDQAVYDSLKKAGLAEFVDQLEEGMDYFVGEKGAFLSGGQRQRIALARAFLRNRKFIVLDEGTSALDEKSAREIEGQLLSMEDVTLITITHRLMMEEKYDIILRI